MRTIEVEVTKEDIDKGQRADCYRCPVARAMSRAVGSEIQVNRLKWGFADLREYKPLPESAIDFIRDFDRGFRVGPTVFTVEVE